MSLRRSLHNLVMAQEINCKYWNCAKNTYYHKDSTHMMPCRCWENLLLESLVSICIIHPVETALAQTGQTSLANRADRFCQWVQLSEFFMFWHPFGWVTSLVSSLLNNILILKVLRSLGSQTPELLEKIPKIGFLLQFLKLLKYFPELPESALLLNQEQLALGMMLKLELLALLHVLQQVYHYLWPSLIDL